MSPGGAPKNVQQFPPRRASFLRMVGGPRRCQAGRIRLPVPHAVLAVASAAILAAPASTAVATGAAPSGGGVQLVTGTIRPVIGVALDADGNVIGTGTQPAQVTRVREGNTIVVTIVPGP